METIIISSEFYFKAPYCELTSDAKLLYAHLYTQALTGQEYISCTQKDAAKLLHCTEGTAGKALRSLQDIGLIERFVARRKETLISVYGTDGKPIQPQGDILPSTLAENISRKDRQSHWKDPDRHWRWLHWRGPQHRRCRSLPAQTRAGISC